MQLWDLNKKYCRNTMMGHVNSVNHCRFSPNDEYVASCSTDGTVKVQSVFLNQLFVLMMDFFFWYKMQPMYKKTFKEKLCIRKTLMNEILKQLIIGPIFNARF